LQIAKWQTVKGKAIFTQNPFQSRREPEPGIKCRKLTITLNGDRFEVVGPLTVTDLLTRLQIEPRRVAVEHNLTVVRRAAYGETMVHEGDEVEIVNFVGGG
jgi:sulfur carrier protein